MESGYTFYASSHRIDQHKLAWFSILWTIIIGFIILLLFHNDIFRSRITSSFSKEDYLAYSLEYICGILLMNFFSVLFFAQKNFWLPNLIIGTINILLSILIVVASRKNLLPSLVIHSYFISVLIDGISLALAFLWINKSYKSISLPRKYDIKILLKYSIIALASNFIFFLVYRIDFWYVEHYRTQIELGNYIQASKLGQMLLIIPQIMASVVFPQTAEGMNDGLIKLNLFIISRLLIQLFIVITVLDIFIGQWGFTFVFGNSFHLMNLPFLLLLPGILALAILTLFSAYFAGKNKVVVDVIGASIALLFVVVGNFTFTNKYGIAAAAIISSIGYTINLGYSTYMFFRSETDYSFRDFFLWKASDYKLIKDLLKKH